MSATGKELFGHVMPDQSSHLCDNYNSCLIKLLLHLSCESTNQENMSPLLPPIGFCPPRHRPLFRSRILDHTSCAMNSFLARSLSGIRLWHAHWGSPILLYHTPSVAASILQTFLESFLAEIKGTPVKPPPGSDHANEAQISHPSLFPSYHSSWLYRLCTWNGMSLAVFPFPGMTSCAQSTGKIWDLLLVHCPSPEQPLKSIHASGTSTCLIPHVQLFACIWCMFYGWRPSAALETEAGGGPRDRLHILCARNRFLSEACPTIQRRSWWSWHWSVHRVSLR